MSYIGTTKIGGMYLGSTEIAKAYLGSDLVFQKGGVPLPYDAEICYIESTGTQYIDTGVIPTADTTIIYKFMNKEVTGNVILGYNNGNDNQDFRLFNYNSQIYFDGIGGRRRSGSSLKAGVVYKLVLYNYGVMDYYSHSTLLSDNNPYTGTAVDTIKVNGATSCSKNRSYSLQIYEAGVLIRDFIAVRLNGEGYFYDRVQGQLYANQGTGSFLVGPDRPTYDAVVHYIQTDGTAYINTGVKVGSTIKYDINIYYPGGASAKLFGGRDGSASNAMYLEADTANDAVKWSFGTGTVQATPGIAQGYHNFETYILQAYNLFYDNRVDLSASSQTFSGNAYFALGAMLGENGADGCLAGTRILRSRLYDGQSMIRDYIPVRKNGVGYLYDRITEELVGTADLAGSFSYGADVPYSAELRDVGNSGTQYIDTGIPLTQNIRLTMGMSFTQFSGNSMIFGAYMDHVNNPRAQFYNQSNGQFTGVGVQNYGNASNIAVIGAYYVVTSRTTSVATNTDPLYIFARNNDINAYLIHSGMNLCHCTVGGDTLLLSLIPVKAGGAALFYDMVTNGLIYNTGTGAFIAGEEYKG